MFSLDSKFMCGMNRLTDLMILNLVYLVTCVPIFTIGAANAALYCVCFRMGTEQEGHVLKDYFRAFCSNFRQGSLLWILFLLVGGVTCLDIVLLPGTGGAIHCLFYLFVFLLVLGILMSGYVFPLLSQFQNSCMATLKNALILSMAYLPRTILIAALNVLPWAVLLVNPYLFWRVVPLWLTFYFSGSASIGVRLLRKVFAPYMNPEEEA